MCNRSWSISGIAIRQATTLGLNLRNETKGITEASKEIRYRVWWALCSVERLLAVMTGRPSSFSETDCTAPLPLPFEEDALHDNVSASPENMGLFRRISSQESKGTDGAASTPSDSAQSFRIKSPSSNQSIASMAPRIQKSTSAPNNALGFAHHSKLSTFTSEVLNSLYRADAMNQSWAHVQSIIANLNTKLETWRADLPALFDFTRKQRDQHFMAQRLNLGFFYYSTLMIINRPCLCRIDRKIRNESGVAKVFDRETAARCVHAAQGMLALLPDEPNAVGLYKVAPWWCLVHYLMQSATVLMLELSFRANHMPVEVDDIFDSAKKTLEWLRTMSEDDEAARRAWSMCNELLPTVAAKVGKFPDDASIFQQGETHLLQNVDVSCQPEMVQNPGYPPFLSHTFSTYDQITGYGGYPTTSSQPYDDIFPTLSNMEGMTFNDRGYFGGQDN